MIDKRDRMSVSTRIPLLRESGSSLVAELLDTLIARESDLATRCEQLQATNRTLEALRDDALAQFTEVAQDKERLEQELYSKFVLLFNKKKAKVVELKKQLKQLEGKVRAAASARRTRVARSFPPRIVRREKGRD